METEPTVVVAEIIEDDEAEQTVGKPGFGCLTAGIGVVLVLIGIPMLVCPGPGMAVIALGTGMVLAGLGLRSRGR